jgi:hypothetical protein
MKSVPWGSALEPMVPQTWEPCEATSLPAGGRLVLTVDESAHVDHVRERRVRPMPRVDDSHPDSASLGRVGARDTQSAMPPAERTRRQRQAVDRDILGSTGNPKRSGWAPLRSGNVIRDYSK